MHMIALFFVLFLWFVYYDEFIRIIYLLSRVASLVLGEMYGCLSTSEITLETLGKIGKYQTTTKIF